MFRAMEDRKFIKPRRWSNKELFLFSELFEGKVLNVSGWKDVDKDGRRYRDYFKNAKEYHISNYESEASGYQGDLENEFYLDLTKNLDSELVGSFDVCFNHTTLEHVYDFQKAFANICLMSSDVVIVVLPFLQEQHAEYGDYWRFTPLAIRKMFESNKLDMIYINYNDLGSESIYVFAVGVKNKEKWRKIEENSNNKLCEIDNVFVGTKLIKNTLIFRFLTKLKVTLNLLLNRKEKSVL